MWGGGLASQRAAVFLLRTSCGLTQVVSGSVVWGGVFEIYLGGIPYEQA